MLCACSRIVHEMHVANGTSCMCLLHAFHSLQSKKGAKHRAMFKTSSLFTNRGNLNDCEHNVQNKHSLKQDDNKSDIVAHMIRRMV
jgi:hypothetical protein